MRSDASVKPVNVAAVDEQLLNPTVHASTVGIDPAVHQPHPEHRQVRALGASNAPMAIDTYTFDTLPPTEGAIQPPVDAVLAGSARFDGGRMASDDDGKTAADVPRQHP